MKTRIVTALALLAASTAGARLGALLLPAAQDGAAPAPAAAPQEPDEGTDFSSAASIVERQRDEANAALAALRQRIADEQLPLSGRLRELEAELIAVRKEFNEANRLRDVGAQTLISLNEEVRLRKDSARYIQNLFNDYARNFDTRVHVAEKQRYQDRIQAALLAPDNASLTESEVLEAQARMVFTGIERLEEALGGARFEGRAIDASGLLAPGTFLVVGPTALFRSADGLTVGTAEQRIEGPEPVVVEFAEPELTELAGAVVLGQAAIGKGLAYPLDPTLGNAHKIALTDETFVEHVKKGGPVMVPIFVLAGAALLVALFKWLSMAFVRRPSRKQTAKLMRALAAGDEAAARSAVHDLRGPTGRMLAAGVENMRQPRELVEEVMYESVLTTKFKLNGFLPFVAIAAASAPLLGLLGTVTGIINTFKKITIYGSGDVKMLSGGISEALITTKFGLIVAIPSLLLHAFLSRKARGIVGEMERAAVSFVNNLSKAPFSQFGANGAPEPTLTPVPAPDPSAVRRQVSEILTEMLGPLVEETSSGSASRGRSGQPS